MRAWHKEPPLPLVHLAKIEGGGIEIRSPVLPLARSNHDTVPAKAHGCHILGALYRTRTPKKTIYRSTGVVVTGAEKGRSCTYRVQFFEQKGGVMPKK
jgi:hypothetical protein